MDEETAFSDLYGTISWRISDRARQRSACLDGCSNPQPAPVSTILAEDDPLVLLALTLLLFERIGPSWKPAVFFPESWALLGGGIKAPKREAFPACARPSHAAPHLTNHNLNPVSRSPLAALPM